MTKKVKIQQKLTQPKKLQGTVMNVIDPKTIKVKVEIKFSHPLYRKIIKTHKSYLVHTDKGEFEKGQKVWIQEGKPVSKHKSFYLIDRQK